MKIGLIGNGVHSKRIQKILKKYNKNYLLYNPPGPNYFNKNEFENLQKCNVIFILTPNQSHFSYIDSLNKNRYIFCEKPPVSNKKQLIKLKKIKSQKIYFNYNFRFSRISEILKSIKKYKLGKLLYGSIINSHGLALKKKYISNWRSNKKLCPKGIYEIVNIHYIDLINYFFNIKKISEPKKINHSKVGTSYDTDLTEITLSGNSYINIFATYYAALISGITFIFENGIIEQKRNKIIISGPSLNLDKNGFFKKPKIKYSFAVSERLDYLLSLEKSVIFFLRHVKQKKKFNKNDFNKSIQSNNFII